MAIASPPENTMTVDEPVRRRRFTVEDYYQMADVGILAPKERVELIEGEILVMSPIGNPHQACVDRLNDFSVPRLTGRAIVRVQGSIRLGKRSAPQPDLVLLRPRPDFYASGFANAQDVFLVIEVMDTSARYDRGIKLPLYARAGISEVWLVDLKEQCIEVYRKPVSGAYTERAIYTRGQSLTPAAFPDVVLAVNDILG